MALDGIIFDVDGTLLDTNQLHIEAFIRSFNRHGYRVAPDRVAPEVGKGGDKLVAGVLGPSADKKDGESIREVYNEEFAKLLDERGCKPFPGVQQLLETLRNRGLRTSIATSAKQEIFDSLCKSAGVDLAALCDEVVTASDVEQTKPAPDIVLAAAKKLQLSVAQCAMIGDTVHDAESCKRAGVVCIGVLTGGNPYDLLKSSGARLVYDDVQHVLNHLDEALEKASPGTAKITVELQERLMREALEAAREGARNGEAPIGSVLARGDGTVIARGYNQMQGTQNKTAHAEIVTFAQAAGKVPIDARDLLLVSTLEPCVMCTGAAMESAVDTILYALPAPTDQGTTRISAPHSPESQMPRIVGGILQDESQKLFESWLHKNPDHPGATYVRQLLEHTS